jgi:ribosomal protein S18 acetylase RimI-like enzyme
VSDDVHIRSAEPSDAALVRRLLVETWHHTYDRLLGSETVSTITTRWHSEEALSRQIADPKVAFLVATDLTFIVGHVLGWADADGDITLSRLYVLPPRQSEGIGRLLIEALIDRFPGAAAISAAVHAENEGALRFYRAAGFELGDEFEEDETFAPGCACEFYQADRLFSSGYK